MQATQIYATQYKVWICELNLIARLRVLNNLTVCFNAELRHHLAGNGYTSSPLCVNVVTCELPSIICH